MDSSASQQPQAGDAFWERLARFGFVSWMQHGRGCVVVREPEPGKKWNPDEPPEYMPADSKSPKLMPEARAIVRSYDPSQEVALAIVDRKGQTVVLQVGASRLGTPPMEAFRAWSVQEGHGRLVPGEVLRLKDEIAGPPHVPVGTYVFLGRVGATMTLSRAGLDRDEEICVTGDPVKVHCDFEECFSASPGIVICLGGMKPDKKSRPKGRKA